MPKIFIAKRKDQNLNKKPKVAETNNTENTDIETPTPQPSPPLHGHRTSDDRQDLLEQEGNGEHSRKEDAKVATPTAQPTPPPHNRPPHNTTDNLQDLIEQKGPWEHFGKEETSENGKKSIRAFCKICRRARVPHNGWKYGQGGSTGNLWGHLQKKHRSIYLQTEKGKIEQEKSRNNQITLKDSFTVTISVVLFLKA